MQLFGIAAQAGRAATPTITGRQAGEEATSKAETILGREPTGVERQRIADVEPSGPLITQTQESAFQKGLGEADAADVTAVRERSDLARRTIVETGRIRAALESQRFKTGVFSDARVFLGRLFDFIDVETPSDIIGDAATADTLDSAANRLGLDIAEKLGRVTNMSLRFIRDSLPALSRTPEGNLILVEVMERIAQRDIEIDRLQETFLSEFQTIRPKGRKSLREAVLDLDDTDPIISDKLRQRIIEGSQKAPRSFKSFDDPFTLDRERPIPDVPSDLPEGSVFVDFTEDGGLPVFRDPEGKLWVDEDAG